MFSKFVIIDGNSLACRAILAHNPYKGADLCNSAGRVTGGTYRFVRIFSKILSSIVPTHILVAWDTPYKTFRHEIYSDYKANRNKGKSKKIYTEDSFQDIKDILDLLGVKSVSIVGFEGDDIVGSYAKLSKATKNFIITGDKDSFQLANDNTSIIFPNNGFSDIKIVTPDFIKEQYGIPHTQFIELKALMGDDGDNIKGIDGCGEKTAVKLLQHFGGLDNIVANCHNIDIKGVNKTVKQNILEWSERVDIVKQLVTIRQDVDVPYGFNDCLIEVDWRKARSKFEELEFNSYLKQIEWGELNGIKPLLR